MSIEPEDEAIEDTRLAPRASVRAHMRHLMAAAAALGVANAAACSHKDNAAPDAAPADAGEDAAPSDVVDAAPDADATAESTLDATTFAGPDAARARAEAGAPKGHGHGYRVVDPLPPPSRMRKQECNPPYTIDLPSGRRKYKPECIE